MEKTQFHVTVTNVAPPMALNLEGSLQTTPDLALPSTAVAKAHEGKGVAILIENLKFDMKLSSDQRVKATEEALEEAGIPALEGSVRLGRAERKDGNIYYHLNAVVSSSGEENPWVTSRLGSRPLGESVIFDFHVGSIPPVQKAKSAFCS